jgi:dipeptidase
MCDVLVATPRATENGTMIFAKNSDRDPNEAQLLEYIPRKFHENETVRMTHVEFPQVEETYAVYLSRPWWIWGAEMGANEFGVVIGNTAVFTKVKVPERGILGMDYIRLALERCSNARKALKFLTSSIEKHGQGGNASYEHKMRYHNSFIIADSRDAYVLETVGKSWIYRKIKDVYSISNALTIESIWDEASKDIKGKKMKKGFAAEFSDRFYTHFARGRERRAFTLRMMKERTGEITVKYMMNILRSHSIEPYEPAKGSMRDVCMHYGGITRPSQTASSQVSEISDDYAVHWFTATSNPCLSIFKPFYFEYKSADTYGAGVDKDVTNRFNPESYWWRFEFFHRKFQTAYTRYITNFSRDRDSVQRKIFEMERVKAEENPQEITKYAYQEEAKLLQKWSGLIKPEKLPFLYGLRWKKVNKKAGITF